MLVSALPGSAQSGIYENFRPAGATLPGRGTKFCHQPAQGLAGCCQLWVGCAFVGTAEACPEYAYGVCPEYAYGTCPEYAGVACATAVCVAAAPGDAVWLLMAAPLAVGAGWAGESGPDSMACDVAAWGAGRAVTDGWLPAEATAAGLTVLIGTDCACTAAY